MPLLSPASLRPRPLAPDVPLRLAVTGTDTNVGKTLVCCAILAALRERGLDARGLKPVETGIVERHAGTDAARLHRAGGGVGAPEDVCPITYAEPLAPMVAGERAGRPVDLALIELAAMRLAAGADALVVEGAGGLLVPFARWLTFGDLVARWGLDLVVVAANRLGVLNHALLTVREAQRHGIRVRALVLNEIRPAPFHVAETTNEEALVALLGDVPLLRFPFVEAAAHADLEQLARAAEPLAALLADQMTAESAGWPAPRSA
jgi:dethiobiotin synthetase